MALAYLISQISRYDPNLKITDNPCSGFRGFVIDHMLREGSTEEANSVVKAVGKLGIPCEAHQVNWGKELGLRSGVDINGFTNLESVARKARYKKLGKLCNFRRMATLLLAHHQDDQYETVLMRLINGHRNRALRGMREAAGIPECEGQFEAYYSGWVDDQSQQFPFYNTRLTKRQQKSLKVDLRTCLALRTNEDESIRSLLAGLEEDDLSGDEEWIGHNPPSFDELAELGTIPVEDGGVSVYRPLLEFGKDRLIATCLENNVPWFEDGTNNDPTLTMRNSIRHIHKSYNLPRALQKPAIIALSKNWQRRAEAQDAEAKRLLQRTVLHDFEPHVGSLVVRLPELPALMSRRYTRTAERHKRRILRRRLIVALALQKIIGLVSPELQVPTVANLQNVINRLFPDLAECHENPALPPKAFNIAGLHFMPIDFTPQSGSAPGHSHPRTWYISRQPYSTSTPPPYWRVPFWPAGKMNRSRTMTRNKGWKWSMRVPCHFWDNRFWIRLAHCLPYRVVVMPLLAEHTKPFRESLSLHDRRRLATILKKHAPGKTRYTLPAIYCEEYVDLDSTIGDPGYHLTEEQLASGSIPARNERGSLHPIEPSKMRLLAIPSLEIQLPGLDKWLQHEIRYKRADRDVLRAMGERDGGSFTSLRYTAAHLGRRHMKAKTKRSLAKKKGQHIK